MAEFLLIHGSCHGAWCWRDILPLLNQQDHSARAIDLPGNGADKTRIGAVTLGIYTDAIVAAIDRPVILVGHSAAGFPISAAAMKAPEKVQRLVYLCAYVPETGKSMVDRRLDASRQPLRDAIVKSADGLSYSIDPAKAGEKFYQDCAPEIVDFAKTHLCPQPILPQATPLTVTDTLRQMPKSYIRCLNDAAVPPEFQISMSKDWPERSVFEMDCGHSPFFAQPDRLAEILIRIAERP